MTPTLLAVLYLLNARDLLPNGYVCVPILALGISYISVSSTHTICNTWELVYLSTSLVFSHLLFEAWRSHLATGFCIALSTFPSLPYITNFVPHSPDHPT